MTKSGMLIGMSEDLRKLYYIQDYSDFSFMIV